MPLYRIEKPLELLIDFILAIEINYHSFWLRTTSLHSILAPYVVPIVAIFIWFLMQIHPLPILTELLLALVHNILLDEAQNHLEPLLFAGLIMGFIGSSFFCFVEVFHWKYKVAPGVVDIGRLSASCQWLILQVTLVFFGNGLLMLTQWCILKDYRNWIIFGRLLKFVAVFLWIFLFIFLCVHKWLVCHQNAARVQAVAPAGEAA